ncbi:alpha,alpha-trehalose-phosphate synthase [Marinobacterium zhoushanense]|uniref:Alpha,alpha-trehalose-phosphate synthase n=1 Tax=Marinobacterium zhoushanense TaxID=1679163 RepID=A0ABQ1JXH6_9GAMM|nr:glucosylglycerol-phosphate synthase [Marinobacterium zhoushanense]GGB81136.1 alpha,alpha-trehalose-phosphate synthase [Marinobacterium zhoushanense]
MILATDLDGTFLGGSPENRSRLYQLINAHPGIRLVFVTGRGLEAVMPLLSDPSIPEPEYIICDVGATVVDGSSLRPVSELLEEIEERWPGEIAIVEAMARFEQISRQEVPQARRCSWFCEPHAVTEKLHAVAEQLGCDLLYSADYYLDFLPRGTNKGATLARLIEFMGESVEDVLTAGDTLNDLSMLDGRFKGVCVGASEPALLESTRSNARILHADEPGCGGILDAMSHFGFLGPRGVAHEGQESAKPGTSDLVMVYHRLPYEEVRERGKVRRQPHSSPNGILPTLLSFFADGTRGAWIAWSIDDGTEEPFVTHTSVDNAAYPNLICSRVALSKEDVDIFYKRFSKEAFWPMLHTFWERAEFREEHWGVFCEVNRKFAEKAAEEAAQGALVWIHDYNLWMVPAYLRERRPDLRIAFFHHTHFPSADIFNVVPWRREIVGSLLQCDYVGFHIPRQVENFVDVVRGVVPFQVQERQNCAPRFLTYGCAAGLGEMTTEIETDQRTIRLGANPVGLDIDRMKQALESRAAQKQSRLLQEELGDDSRVILSVERLDYTKGVLQKLVAYEQLLEQHPELHNDVTLVIICVPAAREIKVYRDLIADIEQAVGRINGRFAQVGWTPVRYYYRGFPLQQLVSFYQRADVMWITPLRDGLNLVAKEFVAIQGLSHRMGRLVLSEFTGAAAELHGALLTNPHDTKDLVERCYQALVMAPNEASTRMRELFDIVSYYDIRRWGEEFVANARYQSAPEPVAGALLELA